MSVFLTVLVPLLTSAVLLAFWTKPRFRRYIALLGSIGHLLSAINLAANVLSSSTIVKQLGNWPAPFGITFEADILSSLLVLTASFVGLLVNIYSSENLDSNIRDFGFHPVFFVLLTGVSGAFVTGDLFNLFVWFECILLSSFVLLALGGSPGQIRGALNYVVPNLFSSMLFLSGLGLLYGATGTLNMKDLATQFPLLPGGLTAAISLIFLIAFGIKAAIFPFSSWLPTSYHTPPIAITALFAGLLTKVGVYALIRFFTKIAPIEAGPVGHILMVSAVLTMTIGILPALSTFDIKKVLAYNIISHVGTLIAGLTLATSLSLMGTTFYLIHHIITILGLFLALGIIEKHYGTTDLRKISAGIQVCPIVALLFAILSLSLIGIPPFSGFWPKLILIQASFQANQPWITGSILFAAFGTLLSLTRVWVLAIWRPKQADVPCPEPVSVRQIPKYLPVALLAITSLFIGIFPSILSAPSQRAGEQLVPSTKLIVIPTHSTQSGDQE